MAHLNVMLLEPAREQGGGAGAQWAVIGTVRKQAPPPPPCSCKGSRSTACAQADVLTYVQKSCTSLDPQQAVKQVSIELLPTDAWNMVGIEEFLALLASRCQTHLAFAAPAAASHMMTSAFLPCWPLAYSLPLACAAAAVYMCGCVTH